ncbi:hypothetical protein BDV25DRAFT_167962 [Aspergillus avenaceus]|uniref:Zn(2)-C6 fungal-type domain-containing protein n=1 Tax=Aspergillus avenaceus TaxID=36643 RepID=A0A5N6U5T2_ASPAV|nr:hypothetical protein BDV25DRAFT_167962 [Aspergillus avenaceus]
MAGYAPGGRNSHIPACLECRTRKAKCSKTQPCAPCVRHNRKCVYTSRVSRTPLTREHLTAVETRLHLLESVLGKIFPSGEMQNISRELLAGDSPENLISTNRDHDPLSADNCLPSDGLSFDDLSIAPELQNFLPMDMEDQKSKFVDNYFTYYHTLYPMLHENTSRSMQRSQTNSPHWSVLANMVLAFGAWLSSDAQQGLDKVYFARAEKHFEKTLVETQGTLTLIQSLVLLSEFAQKQGSPEKSGRYLGSAVQTAVALDLQMEPDDSENKELDKEIRRRVWWSVYCAESCSAKIYGRPLLLPEDALITVRPVSNIHENTLTFSSTSFPPHSDESSIYMGLIQQSSYHRLANKIYRRILSRPDFTAQQVQEVEEMINEWHKGSSLCLQVTNPSSTPGWYLNARRRQVFCDRSLRLLVHRPLLLRWLKQKSIDGETSTSNHPAEIQCRAQGLKIARTTIDIILDSFASGRYSKLTFSFTLYALFHALIVPLIHVKADPSAPSSISCMQDINKAKNALQSLPCELDGLSQSFVIALRQLCAVSFQAVSGYKEEYPPLEGKNEIKPRDIRSSTNNIFGNQELDLLKNENLNSSHDLDFSEWLHS